MSFPLGYKGSVVSIGFHLCWVVVLGDLSLVCPELAGVGEIFLGRGLVFPALTDGTVWWSIMLIWVELKC